MKILSIARKELLLLSQKPGTWLLVFLVPLLFIWIVSAVFGGSGTPVVSIYAVNEDGGPGGERAMAALRAAEHLRVEELEVREEADRRVGAGERMAALIIPAGFTDTVKLPDGARLDLLIDPARDEQANIVIGLVQAALGPMMVEAEVTRGVEASIGQLMESIRISEAGLDEGGPPPLGERDPSTGEDTSPTTNPNLIFPPGGQDSGQPTAETPTPEPIPFFPTETPDPSLQATGYPAPASQPAVQPMSVQLASAQTTPQPLDLLTPSPEGGIQPGDDDLSGGLTDEERQEVVEEPEQQQITNPLLRFLTAALKGIVSSQVQQAIDDPQVHLNVLPVSGALRRPSLLDYLVPGYSLMFVFFLVANLASTVVEERRNGTLRRLLVAPVARSSILLGKMLPYFAIAVLQFCLVLLVSAILFRISLGNDPLALLVVIVAASATVAGLGILVAALARSESQADGLAIVLVLAMAVVSGAMFPNIAIPGVQALTPHYWAMQGFLNVIARGQGLYGAIGPAGILMVFAAVFFIIGAIRFRFE